MNIPVQIIFFEEKTQALAAYHHAKDKHKEDTDVAITLFTLPLLQETIPQFSVLTVRPDDAQPNVLFWKPISKGSGGAVPSKTYDRVRYVLVIGTPS